MRDNVGGFATGSGSSCSSDNVLPERLKKPVIAP